MNAGSIAIGCCAVLGGAVLLTLPLGAVAVDFAAMPAARLAVLPDRYVLDGREYHDAAAVEAALRASRAQVVRIDHCAPARTPRLLTTVANLRAYALDLRLHDADAPACKAPALSSATRPVMLTSTAPQDGLSAEQVARYWRNLEP
jgi:hypothetical protein